MSLSLSITLGCPLEGVIVLAMDILQLIVTTTAVIIVLLLMVYFACQLFGPKANAWIRSTREEKIGLSHKKLYNANGFLVSKLCQHYTHL